MTDKPHKICEIKGIDAKIFTKNLSRELTEDERREVRAWVGVD